MNSFPMFPQISLILYHKYSSIAEQAIDSIKIYSIAPINAKTLKSILAHNMEKAKTK